MAFCCELCIRKTTNFLVVLAPQVGLEPTTLRLTAECSAIELLRHVRFFPDAGYYIKSEWGCQAQIRGKATFYRVVKLRGELPRERGFPGVFCCGGAWRAVTPSAARCRRCTARWCGRRRTSPPSRCWSAPSCSRRGRRPRRRALRPWRGSNR